jgi:hypothetical protein
LLLGKEIRKTQSGEILEEIIIGKEKNTFRLKADFTLAFKSNRHQEILTIDKYLIFSFATKHQAFFVVFEGETSVQEIKKEAQTHADLFTSVLSYIFNKIRASKYLESEILAERNNYEALSEELRNEEPDINSILFRIVSLTGSHSAILSIYSDTTGWIIPVNWTQHHNENIPRPWQPDGNIVEELKNTEVASKDLKTIHCDNCKHSYYLGAQQANYYPIYGTGLEGKKLQAIFTLYRISNEPISSKQTINLSSVIHQLARWMNELLARQERETSIIALKKASVECGTQLSGILSKVILSSVKKEAEIAINKAVKRILLTTGINPRIRVEYDCSEPQLVNISPDYEKVIRVERERVSKDVYKFGSNNNCTWLALNASSKELEWSTVYAFGTVEELSCIHPEFLRSSLHVLTLVCQVIKSEQRRISWIGRTMHEVRQPLQGLVTSASEIQRMAKTPTVSRRDLANYVEDIGYSTIRLRAVMAALTQGSGFELDVRLRTILIEDEVLRPIRRVLLGPSQHRGVNIHETINYHLIPAIESDPDLLSIVFYNLFDNALKYSEGDFGIRVVCERNDWDISLDVISKGKPIMDIELDRIFEDGYRGVAVKNSGEVGMGFGLAMCKKVLEVLGLKIRCLPSTKSGGATCFRISGFQSILSKKTL